jgi:DNA-binding transcriptional LysR family regulator
MIPTDRVLSLFQEQIDVGVRIGALPDSSLIAIPLGATRRVLCASPAYLAARGTPRTWTAASIWERAMPISRSARSGGSTG